MDENREKLKKTVSILFERRYEFIADLQLIFLLQWDEV